MTEKRNRASHVARSQDNTAAARDLRKRMTPAETVLWEALRERRLDGIKFRRQHPVGAYVLDFCCSALRLGVELDGAVHEGRIEEDADRAAVLAEHGYALLRFPNEAVLHDLSSVLDRIRAECGRLADRG